MRRGLTALAAFLLLAVLVGSASAEQKGYSLVLPDADLQELTETLADTPELKRVRFQGRIDNAGCFTELKDAFPDVIFTWGDEADILLLDPGMEVLDLSGVAVSAEEAAALMECLPDVADVNLSATPLTFEELEALCDAFPERRIVCELQFLDRVLSTDAEEIDISGTLPESVETVEAFLPHFFALKKVVMCDCGFDSETMDALNRRYPDIRFVWRVQLGGVSLRTDAIMFAPCTEKVNVFEDDLVDLKYCTDLICIDLGHMRVKTCDWVAEMPDLQYFVIADTDIQDISALANHKKLIYFEMFLTLIHDVSPLLSCTALEDLNVCYVNIENPEILAQMTWLKRLWWSGPNWVGKMTIGDKLPDTQIVWDSPASTGEGWRKGQHYFEMRDIMGMYYMD